MSGNPLVRFDEGRVGRTEVSPSLLLYRSLREKKRPSPVTIQPKNIFLANSAKIAKKTKEQRALSSVFFASSAFFARKNGPLPLPFSPTIAPRIDRRENPTLRSFLARNVFLGGESHKASLARYAEKYLTAYPRPSRERTAPAVPVARSPGFHWGSSPRAR